MTSDHQERQLDSICIGTTARAPVRASDMLSNYAPPNEEGPQCRPCLLLGELVVELRLLREFLGKTLQHADNYDGPLTRDQAAAYLSIHPDTLYKWAVEDGRIAYSRFGEGARAPLRFYRKDLDAFAHSCRIPTVDELRARRVS